jgi:predicted dehydrogenase
VTADPAGSAGAPLRLAVIGVGHLGRHHARVAAGLPGVQLAGVHDHHEGRAEQVAREHALRVLGGPEEAAEAADAVVIATPTSTHAELTAFFLERGRDVLVEKPLAPTAAEADDLVSLARRRGRVLAVGHVERHNPAVGAALRTVPDPRFIDAHRLGVFTPRGLDVDVVLDLMIHDLQLVAAWVGRPAREVRAAGAPVLTPRVDIAQARIEFEGGCVANLTASRVSPKRMRRLRVFGGDAYCSVDMDARTVEASRLRRDGAAPRIEPLAISVPEGDPLGLELEDFAAAVRERREPLVNGEAARDALRLAGLVRDAIDEHRRRAGGGPS